MSNVIEFPMPTKDYVPPVRVSPNAVTTPYGPDEILGTYVTDTIERLQSLPDLGREDACFQISCLRETAVTVGFETIVNAADTLARMNEIGLPLTMTPVREATLLLANAIGEVCSGARKPAYRAEIEGVR